ncbi:methyltransferase [Lactobacillus phage SAC12B]|uniref:Methyltransferase n=1 Tax=Lactobacillus phage SAC12B TaxID=2510941 RepID=A0A4Y5FFW7_9CAUD|nr:DNA methyltransferase [Lactobacillus phage SAC12B]QBJ03955.1 methyltransferase [Lactobacillus phage SAC12B]
MKFIDLFAGVGGIRLGMEQAGHECVGWVEWDKFARKSYQAIHKPDGEFTEKDINDVKAELLPKADCWCFGFPCQDISVAGKQGGFTNGKRSSLFFKVTGLIRELKEENKPSYLFIENVKNLLSINKGWDFAKLLIEMDEIGYDVEWDVLDSAEVVPQHRERIFIVGHLRGRSTRKVFPIFKSNGEASERSDATNTLTTRYGEAQGSGSYVAESEPSKVRRIGNSSSSNPFGRNTQIGWVYDPSGISPTLSTMQGGGQEQKVLTKAKTEFGRMGQQAIETVNSNNVTPGDTINPYYMRVDKSKVSPTLTTRPEGMKTAILPVTKDLRIRKLTPHECWRLQGFPDWAFDRAKQAGLSDSQLYKQAGNSVTVPVITAIADRMALN